MSNQISKPSPKAQCTEKRRNSGAGYLKSKLDKTATQI